MFEVVYYPVCGSGLCKGVSKVAGAIAVELGVKAEDTQTKKKLTDGSLVFLGTGCFTSRKRDVLLEFSNANDFNGAINFAVTMRATPDFEDITVAEAGTGSSLGGLSAANLNQDCIFFIRTANNGASDRRAIQVSGFVDAEL